MSTQLGASRWWYGVAAHAAFYVLISISLIVLFVFTAFHMIFDIEFGSPLVTAIVGPAVAIVGTFAFGGFFLLLPLNLLYFGSVVKDAQVIRNAEFDWTPHPFRYIGAELLALAGFLTVLFVFLEGVVSLATWNVVGIYGAGFLDGIFPVIYLQQRAKHTGSPPRWKMISERALIGVSTGYWFLLLLYGTASLAGYTPEF